MKLKDVKKEHHGAGVDGVHTVIIMQILFYLIKIMVNSPGRIKEREKSVLWEGISMKGN